MMKKIVCILFTLFVVLLVACEGEKNDKEEIKPGGVTIENLIHSPENPTLADEVTVSATIRSTDATSISSVGLKILVDAAPSKTIEVTKNGNVYSGVIPAQAASSKVTYIFSAINKKNVEAEKSGSYVVSDDPNPENLVFINECDPGTKQWELYNGGTKAINIGGWKMIKDNEKEKAFTFSDPTIIQSKGFLVLTRYEPGSPEFGISPKKGFKYELLDKAGNSINVLDNFENNIMNDDVPDGFSIGRITDGGDHLVTFSLGSIGKSNGSGTITDLPIASSLLFDPVFPTKNQTVDVKLNLSYKEPLTGAKLLYKFDNGAEQSIDMKMAANKLSFSATIPANNNGSWVSYRFQTTPGGVVNSDKYFYSIIGESIDYSTLVLNEIDGINKTVELYNTGDKAISLVGVALWKNDKEWWTGSYASGSIEPGGYVLIVEKNETAGLVGLSGISAKQNLKFELVDPKGKSLGLFKRGDQENLGVVISQVDGSFQRCPNGVGDWKWEAPTNGRENPTSGKNIPQN